MGNRNSSRSGISLLQSSTGPSAGQQTPHGQLVLPVVGVDHYVDSTLPNLELCISDADLVADALRSILSPNTLMRLSNPSREEIFGACDSIVQQARACPCVVIFFFAGHAYEDNGALYLCPADSRGRLDDFPWEYLITMLPDDAILIGLLATCRTRMERMIFHPTLRPSVAFPTRWHERVTSRIRDVISRSSRCQTLLLFSCRPGKEVPDDGLFVKVLVRHLASAGLDVHDLAKNVIADTIAESGGQQQPIVVSTLHSPLCLVSASMQRVKKIDAQGLFSATDAWNYQHLCWEVTAEHDPKTDEWTCFCYRLCGLPNAIKHFKRSNASEVLRLCSEARPRVEQLSGDDVRSHLVPALMVILYRFEADARLIKMRERGEWTLTSQKPDILEYDRCICMLCSLLDAYDFDAVVSAWLFSSLRYHHTTMAEREKTLLHVKQAKQFASHALPLWTSCGLRQEGLFSLLDCTWGAVKAHLLDKVAMEDMRQHLENLEIDPLTSSIVATHLSAVRSAQLVCLCKALGRSTTLHMSVLRVALESPVLQGTRVRMCRDLLQAWGISIDGAWICKDLDRRITS